MERKIGLLYKRLDNFEKSIEPFLITPIDFSTLINAVVIQTFRNPKTANIIKSSCISSKLIDSPTNFYNEWLFSKENYSRYSTHLTKIFSEFRLNILKIQCKDTFLLPTTHFTEFQNQILFIMSPKMAFILLPSHKMIHYLDEKGPLYATINEPEAVIAINKSILKYEKEFGLGLVIGTEAELKNHTIDK